MALLQTPIDRRVSSVFGFCILASGIFLRAEDFVEDFDGSELDPATWESSGAKSRSVENGFLTFDNDGGNWASGDVSTEERFFLPPAGETTTILWTLGPASITTANPGGEGKSIRYQVGIHSANEKDPRKEHWANTTGGTWIDLDDIRPTATSTAAGFAIYTDDTKVINSQGTNLGPVTLNWNWETENHVLKLEITETEYRWFDGDTLLFSDLWANAGIDTEFSNGFRVLALGMNFDQGRGTTSFEKIEVLNPFGPPELLKSFGSSKNTAFTGETMTFDWEVSTSATSISIDQGVGDVSGNTVNGVGQIEIIAPPVDVPTTIPYTLSVGDGLETITRTIQIAVNPPVPLSTESFDDDFDDGVLDLTRWETLGEKGYSIADSLITWDDGAGDWGHGELISVNAFPVPTPGAPTTITWTYGPCSVTNSNADGSAIRPLMGIFSAYETNNWSRQHWQNTTGGIWLDLVTMGNNRPDGASGAIHAANDTKPFESNAPEVTAVDISDWNWQTESNTFSLVLTDTGFTWLSGETEIGSGLYADYGIDTEFDSGFRITALSVSNNMGRGIIPFESITLDNGAAAGPPEIVITDLAYDPNGQGLDLTWTSFEGITYAIEVLLPDGNWSTVETGIDAAGATTSFSLSGVTETSGIYRVRSLAP